MKAFLMVAIAFSLVACSKGSTQYVPQPAPASSPAAAAPTPMSSAEYIMTAHTLQGALKVAQPAMSDETNEDSPGAALLAIWAASNMQWSDVSVAKNETTFALVQKDSDEARGKRVCTSGSLIQIQTDKTAAGKLFEGLLLSDGGNIFRYFAVGSSGSLVSQSWARLCGVVAGKYDYSNSAGGTGHAVAVVGMFDLPENRSKKVAAQ